MHCKSYSLYTDGESSFAQLHAAEICIMHSQCAVIFASSSRENLHHFTAFVSWSANIFLWASDRILRHQLRELQQLQICVGSFVINMFARQCKVWCTVSMHRTTSTSHSARFVLSCGYTEPNRRRIPDLNFIASGGYSKHVRSVQVSVAVSSGFSILYRNICTFIDYKALMFPKKWHSF